MPLPRLSVLAWPAAAVLSLAALAATDPAAAGSVACRLAPVLAFAAGMSVLVNLAARQGVFETLAAWIDGARCPRALFLCLCVAVTAFLSLDTTAIMLTPLAVALARRNGLSPVAMALSVVWIANLASLPLPVSNLSNLLALPAFGGTYAFLARAWAPALAGIGVAVAASLAATSLHTGRPEEAQAGHRGAPRATLAVLGCTVVALLTPVPYWVTSTLAAAAMAAVSGVVKRGNMRRDLVPWQALALVVAVSCAAELLPPLPAQGALPLPAQGALPLPLAGAVLANLINNLPAYLLLEPADASARMQLLIGVNLGPLVTPWASLATLLWHDQLRRTGVRVSWRLYASCGLILAPVAVTLATLALPLSGD